METVSHYFYVLECCDKSLYAGYTNDLKKRIEKHNTGLGAKYTRSKRPVTLMYYETFATKSEAMSAEAKFKQLVRKEKLAYINQMVQRQEILHAATEELS